jgi:septal ring factor EnvC (AmiA/AmiB activator)
VEFAAPFRSYGLLVILACGAGVHVVLSGLQRLDVASGQTMQAGEPVGIMSPSTPGGLYLEVRRGDEAVDPAPYLRPAS